VAAVSQALQSANGAIKVVKEQAAAGNPTAIAADLARLRAIQARYTPEVTSICDDYLAEKKAKANTEAKRNAARDALDAYCKSVFPSYETAINDIFGSSVLISAWRGLSRRRHALGPPARTT